MPKGIPNKPVDWAAMSKKQQAHPNRTTSANSSFGTYKPKGYLVGEKTEKRWVPPKKHQGAKDISLHRKYQLQYGNDYLRRWGGW